MQCYSTPDVLSYTKCLECNQGVKSRVFLKKHLKKYHSITFKDYVIKHEHDGIPPTCICGCSELVTFSNDTHFSCLIKKHVTDDIRKACSDRFRGKKLSEEQKQKKSKKAKEFFTTEKGKKVAKKRAKSLQKFYKSEAGDKERARRSKANKFYNKTQAGIDSNKRRSESLRKMYKSEWGKIKKQKNKEFWEKYWNSEKGNKEKARRSKFYREFYKTEEGKKQLKESKIKIKQKNLLSINEVLKRLKSCEGKLEILSDVKSIYDGVRTPIDLRCIRCKHTFTKSIVLTELSPTCPLCDHVTISQGQLQLANKIQEFTNICISDRTIITPLEIDILLKEHKIGIEYNGLYWHSELNRENKYQVKNKRKISNAKDIELLTFFEDEWNSKPKIVLSIIKNKIGKITNKIYARNCELVILTKDERVKFFEKNHISGDVKSKIAFGLKHKNEIIAALSLRRPFHNRYKNMLEIARFACKLDHSIPGALSRLIKHAKQQCIIDDKEGLLTYVDMRYGNGKGYEKCGFTFKHETQPRFWWIQKSNSFSKRYNRFAVRAQNGISQDEIAKSLGMVKIYGDVNRVYELKV